MDDPTESNKRMWDDLVPIHEESKFYNVEGFKRGDQTLDPIEIEEIGDVSGKSLLHLMCHFGLDTMSWARLGAKVTGVDFSPQAIETAKRISKEMGIDARFICSDVHNVSEVLDDTFDIVFMSGGVLCWLRDLKHVIESAASLLKPNGIYYIRDFHPFSTVFDEEAKDKLVVRYQYFESSEPVNYTATGSYATEKPTPVRVAYEWSHSVSEILNSMINSGLVVEFFNEFPFGSYRAYPFMQKSEDGRWRLPDRQNYVPLMFSVMARKPSA